jgi:hypothetical protein
MNQIFLNRNPYIVKDNGHDQSSILMNDQIIYTGQTQLMNSVVSSMNGAYFTAVVDIVSQYPEMAVALLTASQCAHA